jgi:predicted phage baseplate assembly protein
VPVTFWLSGAQSIALKIPAHTDISSTQTETEEPIIFSTIDDFVINPPELQAVFSRVATQRVGEKEFVARSLRRLERGNTLYDVFSAVPQIDDALYLGFESDLSNQILSIEFDCDEAGGAGIDPDFPPYIWEAATSRHDTRWRSCVVDEDTTHGLNTAGHVNLHLPRMGKFKVNDKTLYWIRVRIREIGRSERLDGMLPYEATPRIRGIETVSIGGTTEALHAERVIGEILGRSNGEPGQIVHLQRSPLLKRDAHEHLIVVSDDGREAWQEVPDFSASGAGDRHYTLDSVSGEVRFGPAIRQQNGAIRMFGAVPARGAVLEFTQYRTGGGLIGNVETGVLNTLKTALPYINRVQNRQRARGGLDSELLQNAMQRVPQMLRTQERAVAAEDFEFLTRRALPEIVERVRCLQPRPSAVAASVMPGQVYVLVVPKVPYPAGYIPPEQLQLTERDMETLTEYLDQRRLLTTRLNVRTPAYRWVAAKLQIGVVPGVDPGSAETAILQRLYRFLNPLTGGPEQTGWEFGRDLFAADVYQALQGTPNVMFIRSVELYLATPGGQGVGQPLESVDVVAHGVIASGIHEVEFV